MFMGSNDPAALRRRVLYAVLVVIFLMGLTAAWLICESGMLAVLGIAQLCEQENIVSEALQRSPSELQALGKQFLQEQGYSSSGLWLLLIHTGLWLVPVLVLCFFAVAGGFALWRIRAIRKRRQAMDAALIAWLKGAAFAPPPFCPEALREAVADHVAHQTADLHAARKQAADADRFAQDVYHQIKTPLAVANLLLEQMENGSQTELEQRASQCRAELDRISSLAHTLLQMGRFDAGVVALHWQPEDLELVAEETIAELQPLWQARGVSIHLENSGTTDANTVLCDAFWLGEALGNILKNCIEQTPPGNTIRLEIAYTATQTRILVFDPGSFLPEDTDVFARYATTRAGGVGIGLHLARQIAAAHFGTLTAGNLPDGCEFCLTLPVLQGSAPYQKQAAPAVTEL